VRVACRRLPHAVAVLSQSALHHLHGALRVVRPAFAPHEQPPVQGQRQPVPLSAYDVPNLPIQNHALETTFFTITTPQKTKQNKKTKVVTLRGGAVARQQVYKQLNSVTIMGSPPLNNTISRKWRSQISCATISNLKNDSGFSIIARHTIILNKGKEVVSIDPTAPLKLYQVGFRAFKSPPI